MKIGAIAAALITVAGSVLALSWACGSTTPTSPASTSSAPAKSVTALRISGPASVAPGATAQLSAIATYMDGSTGDVTGVAHWNSSNTQVLSISASGVATGIKGGEIRVQAAYANRGSAYAYLTIRVLPDGTYRLAGTLTESGLPIGAATVAVTAGQGTGLSTTSDSGGGYQLYGVAGTVEVQVSKAAYVSQSRTLVVTADAAADFQLTTINPEVSIAGAYELTFTAGRCNNGAVLVPADLNQRHYTAVITQAAQHPTLVVTLGGAKFAMNGGAGNSFSGRVEPDMVTFLLRGADFYYYYHDLTPPFDLAEALDDGRFLIIEGDVSTTRTGSSLVGTLKGSISVTTDLSGSTKSIAAKCFGSHQVTFAPDPAGASLRIRR
jgi:hypothetical protein